MLGQTTPDTMSLEQQLLAAFTELDQSEITTGILYERVPEYAPLKYLDGSELPDSLVMDRQSFEVAYGMINWAHINNAGLMPITSFYENAERMKDSTKNVFSAIFFRYNRFKDNAVDDSLIVVDTIAKKFYRGSNLNESPYLEDTILAFTGFVNESHSLSQEFVFDPAYFFTNIPMGFINGEIDFGDGLGYRPLALNQNQLINFPTYGKFIIKIKLTGSGGKIFYAQTYIKITPKTAGLYIIPVESDKVYDEGVEVWHFRNELCGNDEIHKPLILIEGWDPLNQFNEEDGYNVLNDNLGDELSNDEYDAFFINFKNSAIDIFQQAEYVRDAIEWINSQKSDEWSEENVVVGFSMGGLVGKAALRYMEKDGIDHQTRLFFTYDTPLKGANQPLGMQFMLIHLGNYHLFGVSLSSYPKAKQLLDGILALNCESSRQMLYYYYAQGDWKEIGSDIFTADASTLDKQHDAFYNEFEALGNLSIPEIAISKGAVISGTQSTIGQFFQPGESLIDAELTPSDLTPFIGNGFWKKISGTVWNFKYNLLVKALPDGAGTVYKGKIKIKVLGIGFSDSDERRVTNALPYDSSPGGWLSNQVPLSWNYPNFCFVPTISSLSLDDVNNDINPYYSNDLSDKSNVLPLTHFNNYIGSTTKTKWYGDQPENYNNPHDASLDFGYYVKIFTLKYLQGMNKLFTESHRYYTNTASPIVNRTFNYGFHTLVEGQEPLVLDKIIDFNLDVYNTGKLWINRDDLIAFTDGLNQANYQNNHPQDYTVYIMGYDCGSTPVLVKVYNGGEITIGDQSVENTGTVEIKDNGTLEVGENGLIKLEDQSKIVIKQDGELLVSSGGILNSTFGSSIRIESGGKLHVKTGGILRIQHYSDLLVEDGGQLIIDAGAKIQLWDGQDPDGAANIHIKGGGELVWRGKPDFSGNGYFQFDKYNILTLQSDFELEGIGQNYKMLQLNAEAKLLVEDKNLKLSEGKIVYYGTALIESKSNMIIVNNVDFYSYDIPDSWNLATAIWGNKAKSTQIDHSNFHDFFMALNIGGESNTNLYNDIITNSNFFNTNTAIGISKRLTSLIQDCTFNECGVGVSGTNNDNLVMDNSTMTDVTTGVWLNSVNLFTMQGGTINFLLTGILAINGSNNISLIDGATIKNPSWFPPFASDPTDVFAAVALNGTVSGQYPNWTLYGNLHMDCATLNAYTGVKGSNIIFEIDAMENSGGDHPNSFICHYAFDVCYYGLLSDYVGDINAKGNYWKYGPYEAGQNPPPPFNVANIYSFKDIPWGNDCGHPVSNDHQLDFSNAVTDPPTDCSRGGEREESDYYNFVSNTDTQLTENTNIINNKNDIIIYPNPVSDVFTIVIDNNSQYDMTLFNIFGQIVLNKPVFNGTKINTEKLKSGIYLYQFENKNKQIITGKLIIDKNN